MSRLSKRLVQISAAVATVWVFSPAVAEAEFRMQKTFDFEPGATFRLDSDVGDVSVTGTSSSKVEVLITARRSEIEDRYDFDFSEVSGGVTVRVEKRGGWLGSWRSDHAGMHFEVRLPHRADVVVDTSGGRVELVDVEGEVDLDSSGGDIEVDEVDGDVRADTSGGDINVSAVDGDVDADTSGGSISLREIAGNAKADTSGGSISAREIAGDLIAETSGGRIDIDGAGGRVDADTSGGPIRVIFAAGNAEGGVLSTSGGGITAVIDPSVSLDIDASSSGGQVRSDLPLMVRGSMSKNELRGELNGGGKLLRMSTSGGGVRIESGAG